MDSSRHDANRMPVETLDFLLGSSPQAGKIQIDEDLKMSKCLMEDPRLPDVSSVIDCWASTPWISIASLYRIIMETMIIFTRVLTTDGEIERWRKSSLWPFGRDSGS